MRPSTLARLALGLIAIGLVAFMVSTVGLVPFLLGIAPSVLIVTVFALIGVAFGALDR